MKKIIFIIYLFPFLLTPFLVTAQTFNYELMAPIGDFKTATGFSVYINTILVFIMGAGTGIAVLMIAIGGMQKIWSSADPSAKSASKEKITNAILGLVLLALSALILKAINPNLLDINLF